MGYDKLLTTETYQVSAKFDWKDIYLTMPMNALPGNNNKDVEFRFATNTFDGQIAYKEGRKENQVYGLQSWTGYKRKDADAVVEEKDSKRYAWGLATYHYLLEAPMRLRGAEIIKYAGEKEVDGQMYDLIFITWGSEKPNKEFDQWLMYVNRETKFVDLAEVTISDFFLPMPKGLQHGTARYKREKSAVGAYLPSEVKVQIGGPKNEKKRAYAFTLDNYQFDTFDKELLYPIEGLEEYGDSKPDTSK